jgi:peroxiredoxin
MVASYLLGCVLAIAQPAPPGGGGVETHLPRAQELVYRGSFSETASGSRVQFDRAYRFETRAFVLDVENGGADAAILTVMKPREGRTQSSGDAAAAPVAAHLERVHIDARGKVTADGVSLLVPLDGVPAGVECGAFVETPKGKLSVGQTWEAAEDNRPPRAWRIAATEMANGVSCLKLVGLQQSDDWEKARGDRAAWRRTDTIWLAPRTGFAQRVERVIERREPGWREPNIKTVLRYELESSLQYPGTPAEDRRQEITQALEFRDALAPLLKEPVRSRDALTVLGNRIDHFLDNQTATPYREAVQQVKRRVEAAKKGELPVAPPDDGPPVIATLGQLAPDFLAIDMTTTKSAQLRKWTGRPVLLVFYHPASQTCPELLSFAEKLTATYPQRVSVIGMAMSDDEERVRKQRTDMKLTVPVLNGVGLRVSFAVDATPRMVLLDADQIVRGTWTGWGPQTPFEVLDELKLWLPKK